VEEAEEILAVKEGLEAPVEGPEVIEGREAKTDIDLKADQDHEEGMIVGMVEDTDCTLQISMKNAGKGI